MNIASKIKQTLKTKFDKLHNEKLKTDLLNALPFWLGAIITGTVAVVYTKLFSLAESGTRLLFEKSHYIFFIVTPLSFALAWWVVKKYAPYAKGSGIPQVTAAIELSNPKHNYKVNLLLSIRVVLIKILSSLLMVFGGGVVGREGPTIQIAASIFKKINDSLPAWYPKISKRNMIVTGAAAGLAAAFNTPLGGIVFAMEELTKTHISFFKSALLTGVIIAGLTALYFLGPYLYLGYPHLNGISGWVIIVIIPLAVITGFAGSGMGVIILYILKIKSAFKKNYQQMIYVVLCGLILAALAVFINSSIFGSGKEIMVTSLFTAQKHIAWYVPVLRILGSVLSFTTGAAGGIFAPSLSAGAAIGAVFSGWFNLSSNETNLVIMCGMTGFLTGISGSPFTSSILVSEMTDSHSVIFYIMITALLSNMISNVVSRHSFYDRLKDQYINDIHKTETQQLTTSEFKTN